MGDRVVVAVGFMSTAECVRRVQAATAKEAEEMLHTLDMNARAEGRAERDAEWQKACWLLRVANRDVTQGGDDCLWPWGAEPTSSPNDQCIRGCRCAALRALLAAGTPSPEAPSDG